MSKKKAVYEELAPAVAQKILVNAGQRLLRTSVWLNGAIESIMNATKPSVLSDRTCPEDWFAEAIDKVQSASISRQTFHISRHFIANANGYFAIVSSWVVCEDELASELRERLDTSVSEFFTEHRMFKGEIAHP